MKNAISQSVDRTTLEAQLITAQSRTSKTIHSMVKVCDTDSQSHAFLLKLPEDVFEEGALKELQKLTVIPPEAKTWNCMFLGLYNGSVII